MADHVSGGGDLGGWGDHSHGNGNSNGNGNHYSGNPADRSAGVAQPAGSSNRAGNNDGGGGFVDSVIDAGRTALGWLGLANETATTATTARDIVRYKPSLLPAYLPTIATTTDRLAQKLNYTPPAPVGVLAQLSAAPEQIFREVGSRFTRELGIAPDSVFSIDAPDYSRLNQYIHGTRPSVSTLTDKLSVGIKTPIGNIPYGGARGDSNFFNTITDGIGAVGNFAGTTLQTAVNIKGLVDTFRGKTPPPPPTRGNAGSGVNVPGGVPADWQQRLRGAIDSAFGKLPAGVRDQFYQSAEADYLRSVQNRATQTAADNYGWGIVAVGVIAALFLLKGSK